MACVASASPFQHDHVCRTTTMRRRAQINNSQQAPLHYTAHNLKQPSHQASEIRFRGATSWSVLYNLTVPSMILSPLAWAYTMPPPPLESPLSPIKGCHSLHSPRLRAFITPTFLRQACHMADGDQKTCLGSSVVEVVVVDKGGLMCS